MTLIADEAAARMWLRDALALSDAAIDRLEHFVQLLRAANQTQNLIAQTSAGTQLWVRHVADSAQLVVHAQDIRGPWLDLGSGPGLPGLIVALCEPQRSVSLVESRRLRCEFLRHCCTELGLEHRVRIIEAPLARVPTETFAVISARAFAPLPRLLADAARFADERTRWLLPKGRSAEIELSTVSAAWQRVFHVEPSMTSDDASILVGTGHPGKAGKA